MTVDELRREAAKNYHPDKFPDPKMKQEANDIMAELNDNYDKMKGKK
jgi:curved DNA-binding protein CbpA